MCMTNKPVIYSCIFAVRLDFSAHTKVGWWTNVSSSELASPGSIILNRRTRDNQVLFKKILP